MRSKELEDSLEIVRLEMSIHDPRWLDVLSSERRRSNRRWKSLSICLTSMMRSWDLKRSIERCRALDFSETAQDIKEPTSNLKSCLKQKHEEIKVEEDPEKIPEDVITESDTKTAAEQLD